MTIEDVVDRSLALVHRVVRVLMPPLNLRQTESKEGADKRTREANSPMLTKPTENGYLTAILGMLSESQREGEAPVPAFLAIALLVAFPGSIAFDKRHLGTKYRFHGGRLEYESYRHGEWFPSACPSRTYGVGPIVMCLHLE